MRDVLGQYGLDEEVMDKIIDAQNRLLDSPVPIIKLSKRLGIKSVQKSPLGKRTSGRIYRKSGDYIIQTNMGEPWKRRRFTIAHELAHFLLHKDKIGDGITENALYRSGLPSRDEVDANRLAADILMPDAKIQDFINETGTEHVTIASLAKVFGVSVSAMTVRLGIPM